jgi:hypothetical protein
MKQHKWHKEIKAWADGAEIETRFLYAQVEQTWQITNAPRFEDAQWDFRIKPQPKEPKYLYAYKNVDGNCVISIFSDKYNGQKPVGKIKLEVDDAM